VKLLRYRTRLGLSYQEAINEPNEAIEHAFVIWSLEDARAKFKEAEQQQ
jgi:hypothetical protein